MRCGGGDAQGTSSSFPGTRLLPGTGPCVATACRARTCPGWGLQPRAQVRPAQPEPGASCNPRSLGTGTTARLGPPGLGAGDLGARTGQGGGIQEVSLFPSMADQQHPRRGPRWPSLTPSQRAKGPIPSASIAQGKSLLPGQRELPDCALAWQGKPEPPV